jgi:DNA invertase Pin-like site-specific DNA recombinase
VYRGRPITLDHTKIKRLHEQGIGATEIARRLGCSRGAVYKALNAT